MRPAVFNFPAADRDGIAAAQQLAGAGNLSLNGALVGSIQPGAVARVTLPGIQRVVTAFSAGNIATVTFTVTGFDLRGNAVSDTITGVNNSTVATTEEFHVITGVSADAAVGSNVEIGTGSTGVTNWYMSDLAKNPVNMTLALIIAATANVTVQDTPVDAQAAEPASTDIFNHPTLAAATASAESNYAFPPRFVRAIMNSSSGSGAFTFTIIQAGLAG